jgi:hypothetical protein
MNRVIGSRDSQEAKKRVFIGVNAELPRAVQPAPLPAALSAERRTTMPETALGEPIDIKQVARLLGCSPWTVRQRHIPKGLPHFRAAANGKLVFYTNQIVAWVLSQQKKGGT